MKGVRIEVKGLAELRTNLQFFDAAMRKRIIRRALRAATSVALGRIRSTTYAKVTRRSGLLAAGIGIGSFRNEGPDVFVAGVRIKRAGKRVLNKARAAGVLRRKRSKGGAGAEIDRPYYWKFIEAGTRRMRARPYVRPAFDASTAEMIDRYRTVMNADIEAEMRSRPNP